MKLNIGDSMKTNNLQYSSALSLKEVSDKFKQWRLERHKKGKLPDFLWQQALGLLNKYNKTEVCRERKLPVSQNRFKNNISLSIF